MKLFETLKNSLTEGVYDPVIFKAVFMAGGPGSGKTFVLSKLLGEPTAGGIYGLKLISSDVAFEKFMRDFKLDFKMPPEETEIRNQVRDKAKYLTYKKEDLHIQNRLGLVIDGTGGNIANIANTKNQVESLGYDTFMVFVNTPLDVALQRNAMRPRSIPEDIVKQTWYNAQENLGKFQNLFGLSNMLIIDNANPSEEVFNKASKVINRFLKSPPKNSIANAWIHDELEKRKRN